MRRSAAAILAAFLAALSLGALIPAHIALASSGPLVVGGATWGSQSSPVAVEPGSTYVPYTVYLSNAGRYPIENASIALNASYPLEPSPGAPTEVNFTLIPPGATVPAIFYLNVSPSAPDGVYNLSVFVNYTVVEPTGNRVYSFTQLLQAPVTLYARPVAYAAYWGSASSPSAAYPGMQYSTITVILGNSGTGPAYNVSVSVAASGPLMLVTDSASVGTIPPGAQVPASFVAGVSLNATTGEYPLNVSITYNYGLSARYVVYVPVALAPSVSVQGYGIEQGRAFPGDSDVVLQVVLINVGNATARDASASLALPAPLEPAYPGSTQEVVGAIPPGQPVPLTFRFDVPRSASSPEDLYARLTVNYTGGTATFEVPIRVSPLANFTAEPYQEPPLSQGASNVKVSYLITNAGNASAKFVSAQLILPNGLSGSTFTYVGDLGPGSSGLATFSLDVSSSAPIGNYSAILEITWIQSNAPGRQFTQEIPITLSVREGLLQGLESWAASPQGLETVLLIIAVALASALAAALARARRSR
ncbi:MAG: COG1361 S-layer family protein [Conexivisphaera sp.]|jgi:hypothetical protein